MLYYRLKNYVLFSVFLLASGNYFAQNVVERKPEIEKAGPDSYKIGTFIDVNASAYPASTYTPAQLVTDVLITGGSTCTTPNVSNVTVSPNLPANNANRSWGYFNKGTATFPFAEGVVLTTGYSVKAGNSYISGTLSDDLPTGSDPDLVAAITPAVSLYDAVALEFDFTPSANQVKFNYIFASEEYTGTFPCSFTDGFALLLKPIGGAYTNLAVLPAGAGAVSVTNIRPANQFGGATLSCGAVNPTYFAGYNTTNTVTNFNGRTVPLTANATVIPGQPYHFKMVLADATDSIYDSGVFLEAGSFNIGVQILGPTGVTLPSSINVCDNTPQSLVASVQNTNATYQWLFNTNPIPGATSATYIATQPGIYTIQVFVPGNSCPGTASITIVGGTSPTVNNTSLTECFITGNATFNLTSAQANISTTPGATFAYYLNQADAIAGNASTIATPASFSSAGQIIYVSVKTGFCAKVAELTLIKAAQIVPTIAPPQTITCSNPQFTLDATTSVYPTGATFAWVATGGGTIVSGGTTLTPLVSSGGTYTLTISKVWAPNNKLCTGTASVVVLEDKTKPVIAVSSPVTSICVGENVTLTSTGGVTYTWTGLPGSTNTQVVSPNVTTTYTVTGLGANGCSPVAPATVTITVVPAIVSTLSGGQICPTDEITLNAGSGPNYSYSWSFNGAIVPGVTSQTYTVDEVGTYTVTINNGVCIKSFSTQVTASAIPVISSIDYENHTITINAVSTTNGVLQYSINGGVSYQDSNVFTNILNNANYNVRVRVKNTSCENTVDYFTFYMTNAITPNGDGANDFVDFTGISLYTNFAASIYDRYGVEIFKATKTRTVWDGRFQGRAVPSSTYWYKLNWDDPISLKPIIKTGWILVKNRN